MGALISFITAKTHGAQKVQLKDFLPRWGHEPVPQDPEILRQIMEAHVSQR